MAGISGVPEWKPRRAVIVAALIILGALYVGPKKTPKKVEPPVTKETVEKINRKVFKLIKEQGISQNAEVEKVKSAVCTLDNFTPQKKDVCEQLVQFYCQEYINAASENRLPMVSFQIAEKQ